MKDKYCIISLICLSIAVITLSCNKQVAKSNSSQSAGNYSNNMTGAQSMETPTPHKYYYEMDKDQLEVFSANVAKINMGDTRQHVIAVLGIPTHEQKLAGKESNAPITGRKLEYYVKIWEKDFVNEKYDKSVGFLFNTEDQLVRITSNVEGIQSRR
ncbi:MAG: hypothetical protein ACJ74W_16965 [Pyrinomonadaceae bacterium]